jgi:hypothetical protein
MSKVASFFEHYRVALVDSDVAAIAGAYDDHFLASGPNGQQYIKNGRGFRSSLRKSAKFYHHMGIRNVKVTKFDCSVLDKYHAGVQVEWQLLDEQGKEIIRHDVSYIIYVGRKGIRIVLFIAHNEEDRWHEKGFI